MEYLGRLFETPKGTLIYIKKVLMMDGTTSYGAFMIEDKQNQFAVPFMEANNVETLKRIIVSFENAGWIMLMSRW